MECLFRRMIALSSVISVACADEVRCANVEVDECEARPMCRSIHALKYSEAKQCRASASSAVGCRPATQGCTASFTHAKDPKGETWQFSSGCIPEGWTELRSGTVVDNRWPVCLE